MRLLERNKRRIAFARFVRSEMAVDASGRLTGERVAVYSPVERLRAHVGAPSGEATASPFGTDASYDRVLLMESAGVDENAVFWIDRDPEPDEEGAATVPHDYEAKKVAPSFNCTAVAVGKVV